MSKLITSAIDGAARGVVQGALIGANKRASNAVNQANRSQKTSEALAEGIGTFMQKYKEMRDGFDERGDIIDQWIAAYKKQEEIVAEKTILIESMHTRVFGFVEDRGKAYAFIEQMAAVIRELDPNNAILSNPNAIVAQVQHHSQKELESALVKWTKEKPENTQFSRNNSGDGFIDAIETRKIRKAEYQSAAEKGEVSLIRTSI